MQRRLKRLKKEELSEPDILKESLNLEQMKTMKCKHGKKLLWCSKCRYKSNFHEPKTWDLVDDLNIPAGYKLKKRLG